MVKYFDMYNPSAYWIYLNRDSSKKDSIWLDHYQIKHTGDAQVSCLEGENIQYDLHNTFIEGTNNLHIYIRFNGQDFRTSTFEAFDSNWTLYTRFRAKENDSLFYFNNTEIHPLSSYNIWPQDTTTIFFDVFQIGNLFFAPEIGLIQYVPTNSSDTFSLIKFVP